MNKKIIAVIIVFAILSSACSILSFSPSTVEGSGKVVSEPRSVGAFTSVELSGSADVDISLGDADSIVVEADDNILPLIQTVVQNGRLIISLKSFTAVHPTVPVRVSVTMKSLQDLVLSGSGNINLIKINADAISISLTGSGNITATGTANAISISLGGSGNIHCDGLEAKTANVTLGGSGTITVYASESLDARISGSGTIRYSGKPSQVNTMVTGSGSITP